MSQGTRTRLCATITAPTMAELRRRRDAIDGVDLIELRLDSVADPDVAGALAGRRVPLILTCRSRREGGGFQGSEEERKAILARALDLGADFVDLEAGAGFSDLIAAEGGRRIVLSMHDFTGVPADLEDRLREMRRTGAEVVKAAVTVGSLSDCVQLLTLSRRLPDSSKHVLIGMGDSGLVTRVLAARFGCCWTYAGDGVAPGQRSASSMTNDLHCRRVSRDTSLYGVVGKFVTSSLSPAMHNAAFEDARLDSVYVPLVTADVEDFLRFASAFDVRGASVTIPFKTEMYHSIDAADALSRRVQAINTVRRDGERWVGTNTDVAGFLRPLADDRLSGARAAILGAGGAARAVAVALSSVGARVTVCARDLDRAKAVAAIVGGVAGGMPPPPGTWDLLVNATPVGGAPCTDDTPLPGYRFDGATVYDLVYNPAETRLLREASAAGCRTIGGLGMLVAQAEDQFEWWTGRRPAARVFREAALHGLRAAAMAP